MWSKCVVFIPLSLLVAFSPVRAQETEFRIECVADQYGETTKVAFEYDLDHPDMFGQGFGERARSDRLVAYDLVEIAKEKIEGTEDLYLVVYFNTSPYNYEDYPNHKTVTLHKLSFFQNSGLNLYSATLDVTKSKIEWINNYQNYYFRDCISIGVW